MSWLSNLWKKITTPVDIESWRKIGNGQLEVVFTNGLVARGKPGYVWYHYPSGQYIHWTNFGRRIDDLLETLPKQLDWGFLADKELVE